MKEKIKRKKSVSKEEFKDALIKKALGYDATETIEEYVSSEEGEIKLLKKKITKKNVPPDITAIKILMEDSNESVDSMTDEQLVAEKIRLLEMLKNA